MIRPVNMVIIFLLAFPLITTANDYEKDFRLAKGRAGVLEIGMKADSIYHFFSVNKAELVDLQLEGMPTPAFKIYYENAETPTLVVEIALKSEMVIDKIHVKDKRFRLDSDVGIGSTLGELRKHYQVKWINYCDKGFMCAKVESLNMLFKLNYRSPSEEWLRTEDPKEIPDSPQIIEIFLE